MKIIQEISKTWSRLYDVIAGYYDEELQASANLCEQLAYMEKIHDEQLTKLQSELPHLQDQIWLLQDKIASRGLTIADLKQKLLAISVHAVKHTGKEAKTS